MRTQNNYIQHTNIRDSKFVLLTLCDAGYGDFATISKLCAEDILDMIEFMQIKNDINQYEHEKAKANAQNG